MVALGSMLDLKGTKTGTEASEADVHLAVFGELVLAVCDNDSNDCSPRA